MTAYCMRLGLTEGHLVYASGTPGTPVTPGTVEVPVGEGRIRIRRHGIDLARPWRDLAADIARLAAEIDAARGPAAL